VNYSNRSENNSHNKHEKHQFGVTDFHETTQSHSHKQNPDDFKKSIACVVNLRKLRIVVDSENFDYLIDHGLVSQDMINLLFHESMQPSRNFQKVHHISQRKNCKEKRDDFLGSLLGP
jgi:hypothetical protein